MKNTPTSDSRLRSVKASGFTLIELLVTIAIILILAGITFGISRGVLEAQARSKAKAELAAIAQAIEAFKLQYGDYPWHDSAGSYENGYGEPESTMLLYALTGRLTMSRNRDGEVVVEMVSKNLRDSRVLKNPNFLDHTKFTFTGRDTDPKALLDPWGYPYIYKYKSEDAENSNPNGEWDHFGFHLVSCGPQGGKSSSALSGQIEKNGVLKDNYRRVTDPKGIIFAGE
ncbi:MAG: type II secretion system protein [Lentimonas sp.]